jgi:hypothetical protein
MKKFTERTPSEDYMAAKASVLLASGTLALWLGYFLRLLFILWIIGVVIMLFE